MVILAPFLELEAKAPESRLLNASPPELEDFCIGLAPMPGPSALKPRDRVDCIGPAAEGVFDREFADDEPADASMENTSFCEFRAGSGAVVKEPSFRGCSVGLDAPVEFQRSAKESDIVTRQECVENTELR